MANGAVMAGDVDGSELHARIKAVRREAHHLHAFLRFSPLEDGDGPRHVAWFEPAPGGVVHLEPGKEAR